MQSHAQQLQLQQLATDDQQRNEDAAPSSNSQNDNTRCTTSTTSAAQMWYKSPPPRHGEVNCQIEMDETEYILHQRGAISVREQVLLDTGSTMDLFCNSKLLSGTPYLAERSIQMLTNTGPKVHRHQENVSVFSAPV